MVFGSCRFFDKGDLFMKKRILAALLALCMITLSVGCNDSSSSSESSSSQSEADADAVDADADAEVSEGDGSWNVFVYLCGSDLESEHGCATMDIGEMMAANCGDNVKFIVQTGGTTQWQNTEVPSDKSARFVVTGGETNLVGEQDLSSMAESSQLADFLKWGTENYQADKNALILWNHGGGSISGVCFDETTTKDGNTDSLSLKEIDEALSQVTSEDNKFELIGFDACLMGTVEAANMLSKHAKYMVGSQETEPGCGWSYTPIGQYLTETPDADGSDLGTVICDSYLEGCNAIEQGNDVTLSVIDLSMIGEVNSAIDEHFKQIYENSGDMLNVVDLVRKAEYAENFGGNNKNEGYTNMIDLSALIDSSYDLSDSSEDVKTAISNAVIYSVGGDAHAGACGLSTFYPYGLTDGSTELSIFNDVSVSTYYMALINKLVYAMFSNGDMSGFDDSALFEQGTEANVEYADDIKEEESKFIKFEEPPILNDDGTYYCKLTEEALGYTVDAQGALLIADPDTEDMLMLGFSNDCIEMDWDNGDVNDKFDGTWFCLGDGQFLSVYPTERNDDYAVYSSPIKLNGEEVFLHIKYDFGTAQAEIMGVCEAIDASGAASRDTIVLSKGDKIVPLYLAQAGNSEELETIDGDEFVFDGDNTIYYQQLPDGVYLYGFQFTDIYGNTLLTDLTGYTIDGDTIGYSKLLDEEEE